jgi:hypothetical protein
MLKRTVLLCSVALMSGINLQAMELTKQGDDLFEQFKAIVVAKDPNESYNSTLPKFCFLINSSLSDFISNLAEINTLCILDPTQKLRPNWRETHMNLLEKSFEKLERDVRPYASVHCYSIPHPGKEYNNSTYGYVADRFLQRVKSFYQSLELDVLTLSPNVRDLLEGEMSKKNRRTENN